MTARCQDAARMGEHACANRAQCWEPCGELGKSEEHARPVTEGKWGALGRAVVAEPSEDGQWLNKAFPAGGPLLGS